MNQQSEQQILAELDQDQNTQSKLKKLATLSCSNVMKLNILTQLQKKALTEFTKKTEEARRIGYIQRPQPDQEFFNHLDHLIEAGCHMVFHDLGQAASQQNTTGFNQALSCLTPHDSLIICRISELSPPDHPGHDLTTYIEVIKGLFKKRINFLALSNPLTANAPINSHVDTQRIQETHLLWGIAVAFLALDIADHEQFLNARPSTEFIAKLAEHTRHYLNEREITEEKLKKTVQDIASQTDFYQRLHQNLKSASHHDQLDQLNHLSDQVVQQIGSLYQS